MKSFKFANKQQHTFGGFNREVVSQMSFDEFKAAHEWWGADQRMPADKRDADLRSIYDKIKSSPAANPMSHKGRDKKVIDSDDLEKKEEGS